MADDPFQAALDKIEQLDAESARLKAWVNEGDRMLGREPRFADLAQPFAAAGTTPRPSQRSWPPGTFYNKPLAAAVRQILEARATANGGNAAPVSVDEIHDALTQGSFAFETSGVENQKNSIRISLGKNSAAFVRLPNSDMFGLCDWYGVRTRQRPRKAANGSEASPATAPAESGETTAEAPAEASSVTEDK